jgi:iron complex transport system ATP-binding protein
VAGAARAEDGGVSALELTDIEVVRGDRRVLEDLTARLEPGRLTAVIGPNGAGKSTLLSVAAGLLAPSRGAVRLDGLPLAAMGRRRLAQRRAYLPQNARVDWPISVARVVALGLTPSLPAFGGLPAQMQVQVREALEAYDLAALSERPADTLSGGELSRAMLARATVGDPEILIVDEPTAGLDPRHAIDAVRRLRAHADRGRTVLMAIHDLDLAGRVADQFLAVRDGKAVAMGPADAVLTDAVLTRIFDIPTRVTRDADGVSVRFQG